MDGRSVPCADRAAQPGAAALRRSFRHQSWVAGIRSRAARWGKRERSAAGRRAGKKLPRIRLSVKVVRRRPAPLEEGFVVLGAAPLAARAAGPDWEVCWVCCCGRGWRPPRGVPFLPGSRAVGEGQRPGRRIVVSCPFLGRRLRVQAAGRSSLSALCSCLNLAAPRSAGGDLRECRKTPGCNACAHRGLARSLSSQSGGGSELAPANPEMFVFIAATATATVGRSRTLVLLAAPPLSVLQFAVTSCSEMCECIVRCRSLQPLPIEL